MLLTYSRIISTTRFTKPARFSRRFIRLLIQSLISFRPSNVAHCMMNSGLVSYFLFLIGGSTSLVCDSWSVSPSSAGNVNAGIVKRSWSLVDGDGFDPMSRWKMSVVNIQINFWWAPEISVEKVMILEICSHSFHLIQDEFPSVHVQIDVLCRRAGTA